MSELCPCGSILNYHECCGPYILGTQVAAKPAILMRSRYCAYVEKNVDYLIATWHPDCHAQEWRESIIQGFTKTVWHGLTVIAETPGRHPDEALWSLLPVSPMQIMHR